MRREVIEKTLEVLSTLYVDKTIKGVKYNEELEEFFLVLEGGLEILI